MRPIMQVQRTTAQEVSFSGIGVHTGNKSTITFKPAPVGYGVKFVRTDFPHEPPIEAEISNVVSVERGTTLGKNGIRVHTVEHVLAALMAFNIDNLVIELDTNEPPVGDGSSLIFVEMIQKAGIKEQDSPRSVFKPQNPVYISEDGVLLIVLPDDRLTISYTISYAYSNSSRDYSWNVT